MTSNMNVEEAYLAIANEAVEIANDSMWDDIVITIGIIDQGTDYRYSINFKGDSYQPTSSSSVTTGANCHRAVLFLRDNLLETTGERIWGLTFTLYNNGTFNIDYNYEMPEWIREEGLA